MALDAMRIFAFTYVTRWISFAAQSYLNAIEKPVPASIISVSAALVFPVMPIAVLWPLGLTGIWLNFPGTALAAAVPAVALLLLFRKELMRPDRKSPVRG